MKNYSQSSEQRVILDYFNGQSGMFLSLGENDGITFSNVRALALSGWGGCVVEPTETAFNKLQSIYDKDEYVQCIKVAVADYCGKAKFYESGAHIHTGDSGLVSTLDKNETKRWGTTEKFTEIEVDVIDVPTLLDKCFYKTFDFISIDIENLDYTVLCQLPLEELQTRMVCVETNGKDDERFDALMFSKGFKLIHTNAENRIYAK